ncbi:MAG: PDZ domain-containing protein [Phycisphaerae bacterium]|jgi:hypothetical protein
MLWALSSAIALFLWGGPMIQGQVDGDHHFTVTAPQHSICIARDACAPPTHLGQARVGVWQTGGEPGHAATCRVITKSVSGQTADAPVRIYVNQDGDKPAGAATCRVITKSVRGQTADRPAHVFVYEGNDKPAVVEGTCSVWVQTDGDDETPRVLYGTPHVIRIGDVQVGQAPHVIAEPGRWIGVRMTPIPEPLAAHVGPKGIMIGNIVADSPAADAGLKRYDIIVGLDGQKIDDMEDLVNAIQGIAPGNKAGLIVIRKAGKIDLAIRPADRPQPGVWKYLYDEPADDIIDHSVNLHGHKLQLGPQGEWLLQDLGQLQDIPDIMEKIQEAFKHGDIGGEFTFDLDFPPGVFQFSPKDDANVDVEISIAVNENGNATTIHRNGDGHIVVEHRDADGNVETREYDSPDAFERDDPASFRLYERHSGPQDIMLHRVQPAPDHLKKLQEEYQTQIQRRLDDAQGRLRSSEKKLNRIKEGKRAIASARANSAMGEGIAVEIENGRISVTVTKGQRQVTYRFDSKKEFRESEPELYDKVRSLFE